MSVLATHEPGLGFRVSYKFIDLFRAETLVSVGGDVQCLSALCFGSTAAVANVTSFFLGIYLFGLGGFFISSLVWLAAFPLILGAGSAWAVKATQRDAIARRSPLLAWPLVIGLGILPLTMLMTSWPFRMAFTVFLPALERLADRAAAGQGFAAPERAGVYYVVGTAVDATTGNIGLIIDSNPGGRSGFVRAAPGVAPGQTDGPFFNSSVSALLGGRWSLQEED
jgi:hypothetical protein